MSDWLSMVTTTSTTTLPLTFLVNGPGAYGTALLPARPPESPPLEWLAAEVEKTCALARGGR